jgi:hypothetical protein
MLNWPMLPARSAMPPKAWAISWPGCMPVAVSACTVRGSAPSNALHHRRYAVRLGLGQRAAVAAPGRRRAAWRCASSSTSAARLLGAQFVVACCIDGGTGVQLRLLDLALLVLYRDVGVEFVLADRAFLLHRRHAAQIHGVVGRLQVRLARLCFQCPARCRVSA